MEYKGICDIGLKRKVNQDAIFMVVKGKTGLFGVADGLGGHSHGERASGVIVHELEVWWEGFREEEYHNDFSKMVVALNRVLEEANRKVYQMAGEWEICGSTVVALFIHGEKYAVLSAGDSRVYLCRRLRVKQITVDEVWENRIGLTVKGNRKQCHPDRGKLTNAVGIRKEVRITSITDSIKTGTIFMLCSDGVYKMLSTRSLCGYLKKCRRYSLDVVANMIMTEVYEIGAADNASVVLVKV